MATIEYIEENGRRTFAIVPMTLWRKAMAALGDIDGLSSPASDPAEADVFPVPRPVRARIDNGGSSVLAWREYRGLTQAQLARSAAISTAYLSQIETGVRHGSVRSLKSLAVALQVPLDALTQ